MCCFTKVFPPSSKCMRVLFFPAAQPLFSLTNVTRITSSSIPLSCASQVSPPSSVQKVFLPQFTEGILRPFFLYSVNSACSVAKMILAFSLTAITLHYSDQMVRRESDLLCILISQSGTPVKLFDGYGITILITYYIAKP